MPIKQKVRKFLSKKIEISYLFRFFATLIAIFILITLYKKGIVAPLFINGEAITLNEILDALNDNKKESLLDRIIAEKIVEIEARKRNIQVKKEEIDAEISRMEKEALDNGTTMVQLLKDSDQTAQELEKNVKLRLTIYKILENDMNVTDDQIDEFIYENKDLYVGQEQEEIRKEVKDLLLMRKYDQKYDEFIKDAKANVKIDYFVSF